MILRSLGELRLDGSAFSHRKPLLLLAYLALEGPRERGHLAMLFWPRATDPRNRLSVTLSRIRAELPAAVEADSDAVSTTLDTDVDAFRRALARSDLDAARAQHAGPFLDGLPTAKLGVELEEWVLATRDALARDWQVALTQAAERAAAGAAFDAASALAAEAWAAGRDVAAEPDLLARLHTLLVAGGSSRAAEVREESEAYALDLPRTRDEARAELMASAPPNNLPRRVTTFLGREREVAEIRAALAAGDRPLITLLGPGGIGKTRLALATADAEVHSGTFAGGVFFVALEPVEDPSAIAAAVASALGVRPLPDETSLQAVARFLDRRRTLLVLDNFDRLTEGAGVVAELLAMCPNAFVMTTSRRRLELEEESVYPVHGLSVAHVGEETSDGRNGDARGDLVTGGAPTSASEGVRLFVERARRARMDFAPGPRDLRDIQDICKSLGGAPLGIELAAVWVRRASPSEIAEALGASLDTLETPSRNIAARHRTLRTSFEYSWSWLEDAERSAFRRLAVFRGGFDAAAARDVCGVDTAALRSLHDHSLLQQHENGRYGMHPLVGAYAREELQERPDLEERLRERHARRFQRVAHAHADGFHGGGEVEARTTLDRDHANVLAAIEWALAADPPAALEIVGDLRLYWRYSGRFVEGSTLAGRALEATGEEATRATMRALVSAGAMTWRQGRYAEGRRLVERAIALEAVVNDDLSAAEGLQELGNIAHEQRRFDEAEACFRGALTRAEAADAPSVQLEALTGLGRVAAARTQFDHARTFFERCLTLGSARGAASTIATAHFNLGALGRDTGDWDAAERHFEKCLANDTSMGYRLGIAYTLRELAGVALARGDYDTAERRYLRAMASSRSIEDLPGVAEAASGLIHVCIATADAEAGLGHCRTAVATWRSVGQEARVPRVLRLAARLCSVAERPDDTARVLAAEDALVRRLGEDRRPEDRRMVEELLARVSTALGRTGLDRAWSEGLEADCATLLEAPALQEHATMPSKGARSDPAR